MARRALLPAAPETTPLVGVVVTAPHVYLPLDAAGNGCTNWSEAQATTRVDRRARLMVPADLAKFLSDRDQAEIQLRCSEASAGA
jgi:hypothetical protein